MVATAIKLPPLHKGRDGTGGQQQIADDNARFKIIICGRRWGKTTYGVWECIRTGLTKEKALIWWIAPSYKVAMPGWVMLRSLGNMIPGADVREGDRMVRLTNGTEIWIKSADDPDSLRGEGLDLVVFDEPSQTRERTWSEVIRPSLADKRGRAIFIGTPKGKNWVFHLWNLAQKHPAWSTYKKPTVDNPFIDEQEIEDIKVNELPAIFKQEYEADFGASQLQVYDQFERRIHTWQWEIPKFEYFIGGLDFAGTTIGSHKSAGIFGGVTADDMMLELFEFESYGSGVTERQVNWMAECEAKARILCKRSKHRAPETFIWRADKSQSAFIQLINNQFSVVPSRGEKIPVGIEVIQRRLMVRGDGRARLYYSPDLHYFPDAMERYRYPDFGDDENKRASEYPLKVNDDMVDAVRYQIEGADMYVIGDPQQVYGQTLPTVR